MYGIVTLAGNTGTDQGGWTHVVDKTLSTMDAATICQIIDQLPFCQHPNKSLKKWYTTDIYIFLNGDCIELNITVAHLLSIIAMVTIHR